jgi:enoyl-CoA hydratase
MAALHGHVVAGGLELALACDIAIAAAGTLIGDGHVRNQLLPAAGSSVRLPRKVGPSLARRLMLTGELAPAERLLASGWLEAVVPADRLAAEAERIAPRARDGGGAGAAQHEGAAERDRGARARGCARG